MVKVTLFEKLKFLLKSNLVFFGPGLLLAITAAGEAGVIEAVEIGAHHGMTLVWAVLITLIFKYAFTNGIARYTLAKGHTIFDALHTLPGPRYWGSVLIIGVYLCGVLAAGAMLIYGAYFLSYLLPDGSAGIPIIVLFLILILVGVLRTNAYEHLELLTAVLVVVIIGAVVFTLMEFPRPTGIILSGFIPTITSGSEISILVIIGAVGSSMDLMLYSIWLNEKHQQAVRLWRGTNITTKQIFRRYIRSVNFDIFIGFFLVLIITCGFMFLGFVGHSISFMGHDAELSLDVLITQITYVIGSIPYASHVFFAIVAALFFGAAVVGIYGKAKAVSRSLLQVTENFGIPMPSEDRLYQLVIFIFAGMMLIPLTFDDPIVFASWMASITAIVFGVFGFILIYLDFKLPGYARGSRLWLLIMGIGSLISIYVALILEDSILTLGVPLMERMLVIGVALYIFSKTELFRKLMNGRADILDKIWTSIIFGIISIYGTLRGFEMAGGSIINFRDIGPIAAGFLGGPFVGFGAGLIGSIHRVATGGGPTTWPCFVATILAGIFAGYFIRYKWRGRLTMMRAGLFGFLFEVVHVGILVPLIVIPLGLMTAAECISFDAEFMLPMAVTCMAGMFIFVWVLRKYDTLATGSAAKPLVDTLEELELLFKAKPEDEAEVDAAVLRLKEEMKNNSGKMR